MSDNIAVMSEGNVLQVGSPRDIYDHPTDRFVANFIGESNIVQAELVSLSEETGEVKLPSGAKVSAMLPKNGTVTPGKVSVAIRPEHVSLTQANKKSLASGQVTNAVYFGTDTHYHLHLDGFGERPEFIVRVQNKSQSGGDYDIGDKIGISFGTGDVQILKD